MGERIQNVKEKEWNGIKFRSTFEADTAQTLDALGLPYKYENRKIILQEGFQSPFQKDKVRSITYTPDFELGNIILECKGFETPEWKIKKKLLYKYLQDNEPKTWFHQIHDCRKQLLQVLDIHWLKLGYSIQVTSKKGVSSLYSSISEALESLNLKGKALGPILRGLMGKKEFIYNYNWKLNKIKL